MARSPGVQRVFLAALVLVNIGAIGAASGVVDEFSFRDPLYVENSSSINITLRNNGSSTVTNTFNLTITRNGSVVDRYTLGPQQLGPGENRSFTTVFSTETKGTYTLALEAMFGDDRVNRTETLYVGGYNFSIAAFDFRQITVVGNETNATVTLANTGILPVTSDFEVQVYDINSTLLYTYYQPEKTIMPGENRTEYVRHVAHRNGTFFLRLRAMFNGEVLLDARTLRVVPEPDGPDNLPPVTIIRRKIVFQRPEPRQEDEFRLRRWTVQAPESVSVSENGSLSFPITIRSTGEGAVENVMLRADASGNLSVESSPNIIFSIPPNESRNFVVELDAGVGQRSGTIEYQLTSRRLSAQGSIDVEITPEVTLQQLYHRLADLRYLANQAQAEIAAARRNGINVSQAAQNLEEGKAALTRTEAALNETQLMEARQAIQQGQQELSASFTALYQARSRQIEADTTPVRPVYLLGLVSVVTGSLIVGWYYRLKHRFNRRPKLLREAE